MANLLQPSRKLQAFTRHASSCCIDLGCRQRRKNATAHQQSAQTTVEVREKRLMQLQMGALARGNFPKLVVNTAWLGDRISNHYGSEFKLSSAPTSRLHTLAKKADPVLIARDFGGALGTAGGIVAGSPGRATYSGCLQAAYLRWILFSQIPQ